MRGRTRIPFEDKAWRNDGEVLRAVAAARLKVDWLQWWWCKRYNRPLKDPILQEYTIEELQIEYFMDLIEHDPNQALPRGQDVAFRTGDKYIDDIEAALAKGEKPDLDCGVDPEVLKRVKAHTRRTAAKIYPGINDREPTLDEIPEDVDSIEGFSETYED